MAADLVYLIFNDAINDQTVNRFITHTNNLIVQHQPKTLYFLFASGGGFVTSGVALYNYLRGLPHETVMHNISSTDSIANAVFLAGTKRYASPASAFLLHGVSWTFGAQTSHSYAQMQETLSKFDAAEQILAKIIGDRTKLTTEEVRDLFRQGQSKGPQFALDKGIIHEIREVDIQQGAPVHTIMASS